MTNAESIETLRANYPDACYEQLREAVDAAIEALKAQDAAGDTISRQAAIDALMERFKRVPTTAIIAKDVIENLPSAQPEHTCLTCGRTANNGGWYEDGRTRCPIEEHYALPKDGHCHLWEKQKVWEDDYPERREE